MHAIYHFMNQAFRSMIIALLAFSVCPNKSLSQDVPTQKLSTSRMEHTTSFLGCTKRSIDTQDFVTVNGIHQLFDFGYSNMIQIGGIKEKGSLAVAGGYYLSAYNSTDFHPGHLSESEDFRVIEGSGVFYDKIWNIYDYQILELIELFNTGMLTLDDLPNDIKTWPGKGNSNVNSTFVASDVAPFHDHDLDGFYNPLLGDYPIVSTSEGEFIPSQFTFSTYHDLGFHYVTNANPLVFQFYQMQYVIDCSTSDLDRTVFTQIRIKSYNPEKLVKSYFGLYVDDNLGCGIDDRFGFDKPTNSIYTYNSGGYDLKNCSYNPFLEIDDGYSVVKAMIFEDELSSLGQTWVSGFPFETNGYESTEIYNRLRGLWNDGTALTYGGDGFDPQSKDTVKYLFPDFPNDPNGWSMESANLTNDERRYIPSIYIGDILHGSVHQFEYAELMMVDASIEGLDIFDSYRTNIANMQNAKTQYINGEAECPEFQLCEVSCVWPGDANNNGKVDNDDFLYIAAAKNTPLSSQRDGIDLLWYGHEAEDWGNNASLIDYKHSDLNGNGVINENDIHALETNFGLKNDDYIPEEIPASHDDPLGIYVTGLKDEYSATGTGGSIFVSVKIGDENDLLSDSILGVAYDITWDTDYMTLQSVTSSVAETFDQNINLFQNNENLVDSNNSNRINSAHFNYPANNTQQGGLLSKILWRTDNDATTTNLDGRDTIDLIFSNIIGIHKNGEKIDIGLRESYQVIIKDLTIVESTDTNDPIATKGLIIYPNPAKNTLYFECDNCGDISKVDLISLDGKSVLLSEKAFTNSIHLSTVYSGIYILKVETDKGTYSEKVVVE